MVSNAKIHREALLKILIKEGVLWLPNVQGDEINFVFYSFAGATSARPNKPFDQGDSTFRT
jgi:hypothetical protein